MSPRSRDAWDVIQDLRTINPAVVSISSRKKVICVPIARRRMDADASTVQHAGTRGFLKMRGEFLWIVPRNRDNNFVTRI